MSLRRLASLALVLGVVPACSAIVQPDTTRLGGGTDAGNGSVDTGMVRIDTGMPGRDGGGGCMGGCDDSIPCTTDACDAASGNCTHAPNDAVCGGGMRCVVGVGCLSGMCTTDAQCTDGNPCNGAESCAPGTPGADANGCLRGPALDCNDHVDCTTDSCGAGGCSHEAHAAACDDGFDCTTDTCGATGCQYAASDAACNGGCLAGATCQVGMGCVGGVPAMCTADGNPCTSDPMSCDPGTGTCLHPPRDDDHDGFAIQVANGSAGMVTCPGGDDCDDANAAIHPGATEACNGIDDNCNGAIDETGCLPAGPDDCSTETQINLTGIGGGARGGTTAGSNVDDSNDYGTLCGMSGGLDAVYYVDVPGGGAVDVTFSTDSPATTFDTVLAATIGNTCGMFAVSDRICNDDITRTNNRSRLTLCVPASTGTTRVHVLVDGFDPSATGNYNLDVVVMPRPTGVCG